MVVKVYRTGRKVGQSEPEPVPVGPFRGTLEVEVLVNFAESDNYEAQAFVVEASSVEAWVKPFSLQGKRVFYW